MAPRAFPLVMPIRPHDPEAVLSAVARLPHGFVLHSSLTGAGARWTFFGADPFFVCRGDDAPMRERLRAFADPAAGDAPDVAATGAPFTGGLVGYWAYDFGRRLERIPESAADDLGLPDAVIGAYDVTGAIDHASGRAWLFSSGLPETGVRREARAWMRLEDFAARIAHARPDGPPPPPPTHEGPAARSTFRASDYMRAVEQVKEHIRRGDIFQANLSQRWTLPLAGLRVAGESAPSPAAVTSIAGAPPARHAVRRDTAFATALAAALVRRSPSPHAAWFDAGDHTIVSARPERFLQVRGRAVETRPINGTRPRGADPETDARLAAELLASEKDRAENVMIVDVLRNDLGRVCETGSVETPEVCALERFPQVHHLVSTVTGRLRAGVDPFDLLHASFPGGSITGAPKIRAMEIIDALEPVRRHVYTGAIGYVGWNGDADWNIAIRTALVTPEAVHFAAGGGITADSDPEAEYEETLHKAEGMRLALADLVGPVALVAEPATA